MTTRASETFDVKLSPLPTYSVSDGTTLGRLSIDKQFHGDLEGVSRGEMLSATIDDRCSAPAGINGGRIGA